MIKATELRITNYVSFNGITKTVASLFNISNSKQWEPILLTEEWLEKFGFKIINNAAFYKKVAIKEGVHLHWDENQWHMTININRPVKYIHTLQNLYFDLTGEELTLKDLV